ncbi:MAG: SDR family NAD(P)-dependent oxidoreductase [Paracoccaceae bacterium]|nr:SDR family NAD(P)-dependent oxidoreductase [Paracoccaceae bacterium]
MRVALTGGARGIGAEVAARLTARGKHVTAFDFARPAATIDAWVRTDLNDPASVATALAEADGPFDALVNNAGLPQREGFEEVILRVNFIGLQTS